MLGLNGLKSASSAQSAAVFLSGEDTLHHVRLLHPSQLLVQSEVRVRKPLVIDANRFRMVAWKWRILDGIFRDVVGEVIRCPIKRRPGEIFPN